MLVHGLELLLLIAQLALLCYHTTNVFVSSAIGGTKISSALEIPGKITRKPIDLT